MVDLLLYHMKNADKLNYKLTKLKKRTREIYRLLILLSAWEDFHASFFWGFPPKDHEL